MRYEFEPGIYLSISADYADCYIIKKVRQKDTTVNRPVFDQSMLTDLCLHHDYV